MASAGEAWEVGILFWGQWVQLIIRSVTKKGGESGWWGSSVPWNLSAGRALGRTVILDT